MPGIEQKIIGKIGIGDSTRPNSRGVILKKQDKIVTIGYNFDDSLGAVTPVADEILSSFAIK